MTGQSCPFCPPDAGRVFHIGDHVIGLWDAFPASPGHALLVTRRHIETWFEASRQEQAELLAALDHVREVIEANHEPDGYTIGVNVGRAAGQTVFHLHVDVIPRYEGDVPDSRGGVRNIIPGAASYPPAVQSAQAQSSLPHAGALIRGGETDPLLHHLIAHMDDAVSVDMAVAFAMDTGVRLIVEHLRDVLACGGRVRVVTGDYLGVTQPEAMHRLLDLAGEGDFELRVFESGNVSFHPKAYVVIDRDGAGTAFVGSSNLSASALDGGIEWNYRVITSREQTGFAEVTRAFEDLFDDERSRAVDAEWVRSYEGRRRPQLPIPTGVSPEPIEIPTPHTVQLEALSALEETRRVGNAAGLVVLATGLGKTWLSAFDSQRPEFRRVLFVAHREEILTQAMRTFRTIRPGATLGYYTGKEKAPAADVLFASIQTLGREHHMMKFDPKQFDYVIVDEFHHAAATTYRRLIGYLEPRFLLGLTATPERTDGGDLLSLCGDNLVYRRDVADGIRDGLLCPFDYFGVPDEVDYENIPWRNSRFDEEELTNRVATQSRAENALEQLRDHGGTRSIGFCVSLRHADFMARYFTEAGLRAVAVHSGPTSAPRAHSLEQLQAGDLDIVFAVDMFNEGVDLPDVDTILMLRPTESRILWLQQFGRGLRYRPAKTLKVVDYIGNHRVFLTKTRALLSLGDANTDVAYALDQYQNGTLELPPGCSVTYELEAIEMLRGLIRPTGATGALEEYYEETRDRLGRRPLAREVFQDGYNPRTAKQHYGSWFGFVRHMGDFTPEQEQTWSTIEPFLTQLETSPMTRSYKMVLLEAMLGADALPGSIPIDTLAERFGDIARRYAVVRTEVGAALDDPDSMRRLLEKNPIDAWTGGQGTDDATYFTYADGVFRTTTALDVPEHLRSAAQDLIWELVDWRFATYLRRAGGGGSADTIMCGVSQAAGLLTLGLPDRKRHVGIPEGWRDILVNREEMQAKFGQLNIDVVTRPGSEENILPSILREWFGPDAGQPGRTDKVVFQRRGMDYVMLPAREAERSGPVPWQRYRRADVPATLGFEFKGMEAQTGIFKRPDAIMLFVTLDKRQKPEEHRYNDRFLSATEFEWQSQNRTRQGSELGRDLHSHRERGIDIHLLVRRASKVGGKTSPFIYCGTLEFERWEGERPITVWWQLSQPVPEDLWDELGVPSG